jgi:hypothetical protein
MLGTTQCGSNQQSGSSKAPAGPPSISVATYHFDNARSGIQSQETILTPTNVNSTAFGKLFSVPVDGIVQAQPLIAGNVTMSDGQSHDILFIATQNDSVYAVDASNGSAAPFWKVSLLNAGETPVSANDVQCADIQPTIGITGTPVLDTTNQILYLVSKSKDASGNFHQRLHALKFLDGSESLNGPAEVSASVPGSASDGLNGVVQFNPKMQLQRSALALSNGTVWITWASHCDLQPYHGWVMGYNSSDLSKQTYVFNDTPNGTEGGIWMSSGGPSFDASGNMFLVSGNGDLNTTSGDYGESAMRLTPNATGSLVVADYFSPFNNDYLTYYDADMGISGAVLLPDQAGPIAHLLVTADKLSTIYLINRDNMGQFNSTTNDSVQAFAPCNCRLHSNLMFFNNNLYVGSDNQPLAAFAFNPTTQQFATTPGSVTAQSFSCGTGCYIAGTSPVVSANGTNNAILWALDNTAFGAPGPAILHAYDPANLATEFYNSSQAAGNRDQAGNAAKFTSPVVANGHVYVAGNGSVTVYGLLAGATQ